MRLAQVIKYIDRCLPDGGPGTHQTPLKVTVNTALRLLQLWATDRPLLLCSVFEGERWTGRYVWRRVEIKRA